MARSPRSFLLSAAFVTCTLLAVACGSCGAGLGEGDGGTSTKMDGGMDGGNHGGIQPSTCQPACTGTDICSYNDTCIAYGHCNFNEDCVGGGTQCTDAGICVVGSECGGSEVTSTLVQPNLLIVLDRSCSMNDVIDAGTGQKATKWTVAVAALEQLMDNYGDKVRFGITLFPERLDAGKGESTQTCSQPILQYDVADNRAMQISTFLGNTLDGGNPYAPGYPCVTNIDTGMLQALTDPSLREAGRSSYTMLMTDGVQSSCKVAGGAAGTLSIIDHLRRDAGVDTFVIGFGTDTDFNTTDMNNFADAGGVPSTTPGRGFFEAQDQASLDTVFDSIAKKVLGCTYALDSKPDDPTFVFVFGDDQPLPRDPSHTNGWDYVESADEVTVYGPACANITSGAVSDVKIVFGCSVN